MFFVVSFLVVFFFSGRSVWWNSLGPVAALWDWEKLIINYRRVVKDVNGRGRPPKDPEDRKDAWVTVRLCPSEATIVEQEAKRCGIAEAEVYRTYGLRKLDRKSVV